MKIHSFIRKAAAVFFAGACLQGCGSLATPTVTLTPTIAYTETVESTATIAATFSHRPTNTTVRMPTRTPTPAPLSTPQPTILSCDVRPGLWESEEWDVVWPMIYPNSIVSFRIEQCALQEETVMVFIESDMGFIDEEIDLNSTLQIGADNEYSFSVSFDNPNGPGSFSVYGKFSSEDRCLGFIMFSKGFTVGSHTLPENVTITFHAKPYAEFPI